MHLIQTIINNPKYQTTTIYKMKGYLLYGIMMVLVLSMNIDVIIADCLSGRYKGPCAVWDNDTCRRVCKEEGRSSGHCSPSLKCWCEGC